MNPSSGDLVCSGEDDHLVIQEAIDSLGGEQGTVELSDGIFVISGQIHLASNLILKGQGRLETTIKTDDNTPEYDKGIIKTSYSSWYNPWL